MPVFRARNPENAMTASKSQNNGSWTIPLATRRRASDGRSPPRIDGSRTVQIAAGNENQSSTVATVLAEENGRR